MNKLLPWEMDWNENEGKMLGYKVKAKKSPKRKHKTKDRR